MTEKCREKKNLSEWIQCYYKLPIELPTQLNAKELFILGYAHVHGLGVIKDDTKALALFEAGGKSNALCELYAKHLRNPKRTTFDPISAQTQLLKNFSQFDLYTLSHTSIDGISIKDLAKRGEPQALSVLTAIEESEGHVNKAALYYSHLAQRSIYPECVSLRKLLEKNPHNEYICYKAGIGLHQFFHADIDLKTKFTQLVEKDIHRRPPKFFHQRNIDNCFKILWGCPTTPETQNRISFRYSLIYFILREKKLPNEIALMLIAFIIGNTDLAKKVIGKESKARDELKLIHAHLGPEPRYVRERAIISLSHKHHYSYQEGLERVNTLITSPRRK